MDLVKTSLLPLLSIVFLDRKLDPLFLHQQFRLMTLQFDKFFFNLFPSNFSIIPRNENDIPMMVGRLP